jgi:hypothetical protein
MPWTVTGVVKDGVIVPERPLPEGMRVEIVVPAIGPELPPELEAEMEGWGRASDEALALVERLAQGLPPDEKR